jgi:hypothetical protein
MEGLMAREEHTPKLSLYAGVYVSQLGEVREIRVCNSGLVSVWMAEQQLTNCGEGFFGNDSGEEFEFSTNSSTDSVNLEIRSRLGISQWTQVVEAETDPRYHDCQTGRYFSPSADALLNILEPQEGHLALALPKQALQPLRYIGDGRYYVPGGSLWMRYASHVDLPPTILLSAPRCLDVLYEARGLMLHTMFHRFSW